MAGHYTHARVDLCQTHTRFSTLREEARLESECVLDSQGRRVVLGSPQVLDVGDVFEDDDDNDYVLVCVTVNHHDWSEEQHGYIGRRHLVYTDTVHTCDHPSRCAEARSGPPSIMTSHHDANEDSNHDSDVNDAATEVDDHEDGLLSDGLLADGLLNDGLPSDAATICLQDHEDSIHEDDHEDAAEADGLLSDDDAAIMKALCDGSLVPLDGSATTQDRAQLEPSQGIDHDPNIGAPTADAAAIAAAGTAGTAKLPRPRKIPRIGKRLRPGTNAGTNAAKNRRIKDSESEPSDCTVALQNAFVMAAKTRRITNADSESEPSEALQNAFVHMAPIMSWKHVPQTPPRSP